MTHSYGEEDLQAILNKAIRKHAQAEAFSHQQLLDIAQELGIPATTVEAARREYDNEQQANQELQAFDTYRRQRLTKEWKTFGTSSVFLVALDWLISHHWSWSAYVMAFWTFGLVLKTWKTYQSSGEEYEEDLRRWQQSQKIHQIRRHLGKTVTQWWQRQIPRR